MSPPLRNDYASLGKAVRYFRKLADLTQEEVARNSDSDLHPTWISNVEKGKVNPTYETMKNIAGGIGIRPSRILSLAEAFAEVSEAKQAAQR